MHRTNPPALEHAIAALDHAAVCLGELERAGAGQAADAAGMGYTVRQYASLLGNEAVGFLAGRARLLAALREASVATPQTTGEEERSALAEQWAARTSNGTAGPETEKRAEGNPAGDGAAADLQTRVSVPQWRDPPAARALLLALHVALDLVEQLGQELDGHTHVCPDPRLPEDCQLCHLQYPLQDVPTLLRLAHNAVEGAVYHADQLEALAPRAARSLLQMAEPSAAETLPLPAPIAEAEAAPPAAARNPFDQTATVAPPRRNWWEG
jgi:hypothetical protein